MRAVDTLRQAFLVIIYYTERRLVREQQYTTYKSRNILIVKLNYKFSRNFIRPDVCFDFTAIVVVAQLVQR